MSGRIAAIAAVHEGNRLTVYIGSASGGVWKSENGGTTYKPVFDKEPVQSIGAVAIDPTNPKVIWVGTGESWTRNSVSIGDGIYKSTDGGDNWTNMGLKESERIAKILIDPSDPNTVYACVPGKAVERQRGSRRLQDDQRRPDVDEGSERIERVDRLLDDVDGSEESEDAVRRNVGLPPQRLDVPFRRRRPRRAERQRPVQNDRRRRDVERNLRRARPPFESRGAASR